ncbi:universal stress protein [Limimaricola pyoseonensis]|uniref:Nucleotide-binding universal stress protein, UspA family n=1 Tax=Limimaricola pyoseonensis TaxID=521013 RepID=A0A1G7JJS7_9RHOB|nr:universal stress protein [Limimaricola pyoseonensis]SDF25034.1 Nucleotide-binding universal stress protein, UspA family [Limimaricola pyoseonensis]
MERILVATDLTEQGARALGRAAMLAEALGARLEILHVLRDDLPADLRAEFERVAGARLSLEAEGLRARLGDRVRGRLEFGTPWMAILAAAAEADLLVMGAHRHAGIAELFRGTTVERVARACDTPLLVVRRDAVKPYASLLVATDFSLAARAALEAALHLAPGAATRLLHAHDVPFRFLLGGESRRSLLHAERRRQREAAGRDMETFLGGLEPRLAGAERILLDDRPGAAIRRTLSTAPADLLAVGTHSRPRLSEALLGSVARGLMADPPCDLLAVPPPFRSTV